MLVQSLSAKKQSTKATHLNQFPQSKKKVDFRRMAKSPLNLKSYEPYSNKTEKQLIMEVSI